MTTTGLPTMRRTYKAQSVYENLSVSGRSLWSRLMTEGRLPQITCPAEGELALKRLGKATMEKIGNNIFVFRFDDDSRIIVGPYHIETQWGD